MKDKYMALLVAFIFIVTIAGCVLLVALDKSGWATLMAFGSFIFVQSLHGE